MYILIVLTPFYVNYMLYSTSGTSLIKMCVLNSEVSYFISCKAQKVFSVQRCPDREVPSVCCTMYMYNNIIIPFVRRAPVYISLSQYTHQVFETND